MQEKTMTFATLAKKLRNPKQLKRIVTPSLIGYRKTLRYPKSCKGWESRETHMATRLVKANFSKSDVYRTFMSFGVGLDLRRRRNKKQSFNGIYADAVANVEFANNLKAVIVKGVRLQLK